MKTESRVHGSIFFLLKKFISHRFSEEMWFKMCNEAGVDESKFEMTQNYPLSELNSIMERTAYHTENSRAMLYEVFGEYLVPDLFKLYRDYLDPDWKTFDVLKHTEKVMHGAVRRLNSTANPPVLYVAEDNDHRLIIDYFSERRMGAMAVGMIKGIAAFYNEQDFINVESTTETEAERVQIIVSYNASANNAAGL